MNKYGHEENIDKLSKYKFKIGDRVVCIKSTPYNSVGEVGTVNENSTCPFVNWDNGEMWAIHEDFINLKEEN